ncbi:AAA family ATPase [Lacibacter sp.]|uniref:AAA family ATPase n=1 Tax=Lacibacter sp. TaxID=1915409 RepID=UPI002B4AF74B|nr:AAA family ATPase [Lacibacter sp.]HLP37010.1 AAA family ATPase [Lacibacter sp.]
MYLSNLKVWNFRKFGSSNAIDLDHPHLDLALKKGVNVLIGENDSGKTAIVDAIKLVLKAHGNEWVKIEPEDFYSKPGGFVAERFRIECRFDELAVAEACHFTEWLGWDASVTPAVDYLRVFVDVVQKNGRILPFDVRAGVDSDGKILTADAKERLRITYLRPLRDAVNELSSRRNSRLSQILLSHDAFRDKKDHLFIELAKQLNSGVAAYFKGLDASGAALTGDLLKGKELKEIIDKYLSEFSGKETSFKMSAASMKNILEALNLLFEDGYNLGLGSHNLLCIASELLHLQKKSWDGLRLGLVEEIEAHLHPQSQLQVMETLQKEAKDVQLIFTTHSPNIGSKIHLSHLIFCQADRAFPMGEEFTLLESTDYKYLERFLDVTKANLFFARGVLLVEGWGEELLVPVLARKIGINLTAHGISVVNIGNTAFLRYAKIFQRKIGGQMQTKVAVVTDVDVKPLEAGELHEVPDAGDPTGLGKIKVPYTQAEIDAKIKDAIAGKQKKYDGQVVKSFISPAWTLEYCIAQSAKLRKLFYKSVLEALLEQKRDEGVAKLDNYENVITDIDKHFNNWTEDSDIIAYKIYRHILCGETDLAVAKDEISKAIIAQRFAANLEADTVITDIKTEKSIEYLLNAIKYVSGN